MKSLFLFALLSTTQYLHCSTFRTQFDPIDAPVSDRPERLTREDADIIGHGVIEVEVVSIENDHDYVRVKTPESRYILSTDVMERPRPLRRGPVLNIQVGDILFYDKELFLKADYADTQYVRARLIRNKLVYVRYLYKSEPFQDRI